MPILVRKGRVDGGSTYVDFSDVALCAPYYAATRSLNVITRCDLWYPGFQCTRSCVIASSVAGVLKHRGRRPQAIVVNRLYRG
jgi:hypothetical protein